MENNQHNVLNYLIESIKEMDNQLNNAYKIFLTLDPSPEIMISVRDSYMNILEMLDAMIEISNMYNDADIIDKGEIHTIQNKIGMTKKLIDFIFFNCNMPVPFSMN